MAITRNTAVDTKHFTGQANVQHDRVGGLADIVRDILVRDARAFTSGDGGFTADNSGGVAGIAFTAQTADDTITLSVVAADSLITGDGPFEFVGGDLPAGIAASTDYWVRVVSSNVATLHLTKAAALSAQSTPVTITDAGSGTIAIQALGQPVALVSTDCTSVNTSFTAASGDTSIDSLGTAYATVAEQVNVLLALIGAGSIDVGPDTPGSGTIAVVDVDVAVNSSDTTGTTYGSAQAIVVELLAAQATLVDAINVCRRAVGLGDVPRAANLVGLVDAVGIAGGGTWANAVTTDATTIETAALEAGIEAILAGLVNNVALMALKADEVSDLAAQAALVGVRAG